MKHQKLLDHFLTEANPGYIKLFGDNPDPILSTEDMCLKYPNEPLSSLKHLLEAQEANRREFWEQYDAKYIAPLTRKQYSSIYTVYDSEWTYFIDKRRYKEPCKLVIWSKDLSSNRRTGKSERLRDFYIDLAKKGNNVVIIDHEEIPFWRNIAGIFPTQVNEQFAKNASRNLANNIYNSIDNLDLSVTSIVESLNSRVLINRNVRDQRKLV